MVTIDSLLFSAICIEAAFGLFMTLMFIKAAVSLLIWGPDDDSTVKKDQA